MYRRRAARACSAPAPCSGRGASTTRTPTARRPTATCSRRRSTCSPTWARSRRRCCPGLVARGGDDRHHGADRRRSPLRRRRSPTARRSRSPAPRPTPAAASSRASRSPPTAADLAPGDGHDELVLHLDRPRQPVDDDQGARDRRQRQPRDAGSAGVSVDVDCPCSLWGPNTPSAADARLGRPDPGRGRRQVPVRHLRHRHRHPLLQGGGQHRHAHRQPVDGRRPAPRPGHVHRRDRVRLADRDLRDARSRSSPNTTYVASYYAPNGHYAATADYF